MNGVLGGGRFVAMIASALVLIATSSSHASIATPDPKPELDRIRLAIDRGDYGDAERRARLLLADLDSSARADAVETAGALDLLVESLQRQERGYSAEVREMAEGALAIKERPFPDDHPHLAPTLANLARVRYQVDLDLPAAQTLADEALRAAQRDCELDDPRLARYWILRAEILLERRELEDTRRALTTAEELLRPDSPPIRWADVLYLWGKLDFAASDFPAAVEQFEGAVERTVSEFGEDHPETARMLAKLAMYLPLIDRFDEAREAAKRCIEIGSMHYGRRHPSVGRCIRGLATIARDTGELDGARELYEEALEIAESALGDGHPELTGLLQEYGWLLYETWDLQSSKATLERAIEIAERYWGASDDRINWLLSAYGNLLRRMGDHAAAEQAFERAIRLVEDSEEPDLLQWSLAVINLAYLKQTSGDLEAARRLYAEAEPVFDDTPAVSASWRAEFKQIYGDVLWRLGEEAEARRMLDEALAIRRESLGPTHYTIAATLAVYARGLERSGDLAGAYELRRQAIGLLEAAFGENGAKVGLQLRGIARNRFRAGEFAEAFAYAARAERIRTDLLRFTASGLPERHALAHARGWKSAQSLLMSMAVDGNETTRVEATWDLAIGSRALVVDELAARHRSWFDAGVPSELMADLTAARERLANLVVRGASDGYPRKFREAVDARERAEERVAAVSRDLRRRREEIEVGLAEVMAAVPRDSALVAFVRYAHLGPEPLAADGPVASRATPLRETASYAAFVMSGDRKKPALVPLGPAETIEEALQAWLAEVSTRPPSLKPLADGSLRRYRKTGERLRRRVWDPVAEVVGSAARVLVVPDAALNALNFATLPEGAHGYLLDEGPEFHFLSSERDVVTRRLRSSKHRLLAVGGPDFDAAPRTPDLSSLPGDALFRASLKNHPTTARYRGERPSCEDFRTVHFRPLAGATGEVDDIAKIWSEGQSEDGAPPILRLAGAEAREAWVKTLAPEFGVIHLATHGFLLGGDCAPGSGSSNHPLLQSGLALASANNRADAGREQEDGILTAEEVASLDLSAADWVVLSGCETGRGPALSGEGVFGLRRAFRVAGARTLIMSLWAVDDDATRRWMRSLYRVRRDGATTSSAVRKAAMQLLEENRSAGISDHPFYWGAFVAAGDWR